MTKTTGQKIVDDFKRRAIVRTVPMDIIEGERFIGLSQRIDAELAAVDANVLKWLKECYRIANVYESDWTDEDQDSWSRMRDEVPGLIAALEQK